MPGLSPAEPVSYLNGIAPGKAPSDKTLIYFYGLIAMSVLFGGFWGRKEVSDIQADLSDQAARMNQAPVHKLKVPGYSFLAGSVTGVLFGAMLTVLVKRERAKIAVLSSVGPVLSFMAGLMVPDVKYIVNRAVPVPAYINPASLVSEEICKFIMPVLR